MRVPVVLPAYIRHESDSGVSNDLQAPLHCVGHVFESNVVEISIMESMCDNSWNEPKKLPNNFKFYISENETWSRKSKSKLTNAE